MTLGRLGVEYVPARFRRWGLFAYRASVVLALGAVQFRWWRR